MSLVLRTLRVKAGISQSSPAARWIRAFSPERHAAALDALTAACRANGGDPPVPAAAFAGVLAGRPGRDVRAWLAHDEASATDASVLGFVALVVAASRYSIGWLLVHPHARRRGVGAVLVDRVIAEAAVLGAREVHADTMARWPTAVAFWNRMAERHS